MRLLQKARVVNGLIKQPNFWKDDSFLNKLGHLSVVDKTRDMEHSGTFRNIPEHPGTSNNYDNYDKICKIKFSKTEKTNNFEAAMLKPHKFLSFCDLIIMNAIKIFAVAKLLQPVKLLKSLNDWQFHILLKFKEPKEPIQLELSYVD